MTASTDYAAGYYRASKVATAVGIAGFAGGCLLSQQISVPEGFLMGTFAMAAAGIAGNAATFARSIEYAMGITPEDDTTPHMVRRGALAGMACPVVAAFLPGVIRQLA